MVAEDFRSQRDGVPCGDGAVRPDLQRQLVEIAGSAHAGGLHGIIHLIHRRVDGIYSNGPDHILLRLIAVGGDVAPAMGQGDLHVERRPVVQCGDVQVRVQDLHLAVGLDVAGGHHAGTHRLDIDRLHRVAVELRQEALDVQDNLRHVFLHAGNGGKLVLDAGDLDGSRRGAGQRGEHDPPQGVAQRRAISPLQGFHHVFAIGYITRRFAAFDLGLFDFDHAVPSFIFSTGGARRRLWFGSLSRVSSAYLE